MSKYVRVMRSIWTDPDWLTLPSQSKMIYLQLISQPNISKAGVLPTVPRRWASMYPDLDVDDITTAIATLASAGFVVVDEDTEELLVRTYMRYDEMFVQPNGRKAIANAFDEIVSEQIRRVVQQEFRDLIAEGSDDTSGKGSEKGSGKGSVTPITMNHEPTTMNHEPSSTLVEVDDFEKFWTAYPRKTGKAQASKAWSKLKPADRATAIDILPAHVAYWTRAGTATQFIPHPATWVNGRRWEDELPSTSNSQPRRQAPGMDAVRRLMEETQNGT